MDGFNYMQFVVPGLIMMAVIQNAYGNVVSSFYGAKFQHSIEELLVSPTPNWIILAGFTLGGVARGLAEPVVDGLEAVEIQYEHGQLRARASCRRDGSCCGSTGLLALQTNGHGDFRAEYLDSHHARGRSLARFDFQGF